MIARSDTIPGPGPRLVRDSSIRHNTRTPKYRTLPEVAVLLHLALSPLSLSVNLIPPAIVHFYRVLFERGKYSCLRVSRQFVTDDLLFLYLSMFD